MASEKKRKDKLLNIGICLAAAGLAGTLMLRNCMKEGLIGSRTTQHNQSSEAAVPQENAKGNLKTIAPESAHALEGRGIFPEALFYSLEEELPRKLLECKSVPMTRNESPAIHAYGRNALSELIRQDVEYETNRIQETGKHSRNCATIQNGSASDGASGLLLSSNCHVLDRMLYDKLVPKRHSLLLERIPEKDRLAALSAILRYASSLGPLESADGDSEGFENNAYAVQSLYGSALVNKLRSGLDIVCVARNVYLRDLVIVSQNELGETLLEIPSLAGLLLGDVPDDRRESVLGAAFFSILMSDEPDFSVLSDIYLVLSQQDKRHVLKAIENLDILYDSPERVFQGAKRFFETKPDSELKAAVVKFLAKLVESTRREALEEDSDSPAVPERKDSPGKNP